MLHAAIRLGTITRLYSLLLLDCTDGDVRLTNGSCTNEGTVEVCFSGLWGLISDRGWSSNSTNVVCSQLGFSREGNIHCYMVLLYMHDMQVLQELTLIMVNLAL